MSADQHLATIKEVYEAFGQGDVETILARVADDVDWSADANSTTAPWYGRRTDKQAVAGFFQDIAGAIEVKEFTPLSLVANDTEVHAFIRFGFRVPRTGHEAAMNLHHYFRFRDSKIAYYRGSEDTAQTLAALTG